MCVGVAWFNRSFRAVCGKRPIPPNAHPFWAVTLLCPPVSTDRGRRRGREGGRVLGAPEVFG